MTGNGHCRSLKGANLGAFNERFSISHRANQPMGRKLCPSFRAGNITSAIAWIEILVQLKDKMYQFGIRQVFSRQRWRVKVKFLFKYMK